MSKKWIIVSLMGLFTAGIAKAQDTVKVVEEKKTEFKVDLEYRIRSEVRHGYAVPADSNSKTAFFIGQRSRANFSFASKWVDARLSLQDVRTWGEVGARDKKGTFMLHEAWFEVPVKQTGLSFKLGRQELTYDNQRLLSRNNWRQTGRSHDAALLKLKKKSTEFHAGAAFSQPGEVNFGRTYNGPTSEDYKLLTFLWLKQQIGNNFTFSLLNIGDGFQADTNVATLKGSEKLFVRVTNFGRFEYDTKKSFYVTVAGGVQYGKNNKDQKILAWYVQPEVRFTSKGVTLRAGAEIFSGQDGEQPVEKINAFNPLYGTQHSFNGFIDIYNNFPNDTRNAGLINPYLYIRYAVNEKFTAGVDFHPFFLQNNFVKNGETVDKYAGFETDFIFNYNPHKIIGLEFGYSFFRSNETTVALKGGEADRFNHWAYAMVTVKPELFKFVK